MGMGTKTNEIYKRRRKRKRIKKSSIILLILMLGYLVYHYVSLEIQYRELVAKREELRMELEESKNYQQQLIEQVENAQSDKYIEKMARKYFGLVYPDEKVYIEKEVGGSDDP